MNKAGRRAAAALAGLLLGLAGQLVLSGTASAAPAPHEFGRAASVAPAPGEISPTWAGPTWAGPTATTDGTNRD